MKKEFCRYAVRDLETGISLVVGEKYKAKGNLRYITSFRSWNTWFRKIDAYERYAVIRGRAVCIDYWFNTPKRKPCRYITEFGRTLGVQ